MINSFMRAITLRLLALNAFRRIIIRVYPHAIAREFSGSAQESYLKLLALFKLDADARLKAHFQRFGSDSDGGYILDYRISPETVCLSLGISNEVSFDLEVSKYVSKLEMYDYSMSALPLEVPRSTFHRIGISADPRDGFISLEDAIEEIDDHSPIILKMDIEGDEWDSLVSCKKTSLDRCIQIVVEFHNLQRLPLRSDFEFLVDQMSTQLAGFAVVNVHGNNWDSFHIINGVPVPNVIEVTYLRRDWLYSMQVNKSFIQQNLNLANNPSRPDFIFESFSRIP